jgi:hypothetical protein
VPQIIVKNGRRVYSDEDNAALENKPSPGSNPGRAEFRDRLRSIDPENPMAADVDSPDAQRMQKAVQSGGLGAMTGGPIGGAVAGGSSYLFNPQSNNTNDGQNVGQAIATSPAGRAALGAVPGVGPVLQNPIVSGAIGAGVGGAVGSAVDAFQGKPSLSPGRQAGEALLSGVIGGFIEGATKAKPGELSRNSEDVGTLISRSRLDMGETPDAVLKAINDSQAARDYYMRGSANAAKLSQSYDGAILDAMAQKDGVMGLSEIDQTIKSVNRYVTGRASDELFNSTNSRAISRFADAASLKEMDGEKLLRAAMGDGNFESGLDTAIDSAKLLVTALKDQPELRTKFIRTWMRRNLIERAMVSQGKEGIAEAGETVTGAFRQGLEELANPSNPLKGAAKKGIQYADAGADASQAFYFDGELFAKALKEGKAADMQLLLGGGSMTKGKDVLAGLNDIKDLMLLLNPKDALKQSGASKIYGAIGDQVKYSERNLLFRMATGVNGSNIGDITGRGAVAGAIYSGAAAAVYTLDQMMAVAMTKPSLVTLLKEGIKSGDTAAVQTAWRAIGQAINPGEQGGDPLATDAMNKIRYLGGAF